MGNIAWEFFSGSDAHRASSVSTLFSSSLPVLPHEKMKLENNDDTIGSLLPDDEEELLSGIIDGFELGGLHNNRIDDLEEYDIFGSGGGLELENDSLSRMSLSDNTLNNGMGQYAISNSVGTVVGEHPLGEHPSRTLFVRNINSNVEDSELRILFEQFGDIRTLYTTCKHRGFVMISYYDIRAARTAMRALQNKPLRRRKLDIHFSIPKDNPSEKDVNQGTLVVFNLDPSVSSDDIRQIFGVYGEIKEIRETPHKRHHKFIEFYDVRAAEAALKFLNRRDIAGKRIKLEPSRPGGARRNLMLQPNQELEQDQSWFRQQLASSMGNSPPGNWPNFGSPVDHNPLLNLNGSPAFRSMSHTVPGLASILHPQVSGKIGNDHIYSNGSPNQRNPFQHSHSFPEPKSSHIPGTVSSFGASSSNGSVIETLSGPQFLWGSPKIYPDQDNINNNTSSWVGRSNGQNHGFSFSNHHGSFFNSPQHYHNVGSAPSNVPFERHFGFHQESPEKSSVGLAQKDGSFIVNVGNHGYPGPTMISPPGLVPPIYLHNTQFPPLESYNDRWRNRHIENSGNQMDNQKQFQLNLDKIRRGQDKRTTLMIKNIPNKYTSKMLLASIDEYHKGIYDFLYLPIDFKNRCNVGYAFINMLSPSHIIPFYETFNGKTWEKFNSEKVASLAYARIQGKAALITHFQNSSLMNEDKRCRPIVFQSGNSESDDQIIHEHLHTNSSLNVQFHQTDSLGGPSKDVKAE